MGITALISAIIGLVSGALPDVLKLVKDGQEAKREREFLLLQHQMQLERMKSEAGSKLQEAEAGIVAEEIRAMRDHLVEATRAAGKPSGVVWVDAMNALVRPIMSYFVLLLYVVTSLAVTYATLRAFFGGQAMDEAIALSKAIWTGIVGFTIEAVFGFWFASRSARKPPIHP